MKKCPAGQYYCFTDKKCKKIPMGYHVGGRGMLEKDTEESEAKKNGNGISNGNGNGNGNGANGGNGGGNGGGMGEQVVHEGTLRKWFKGSKSKDGKGGWVNVVTGGTCASDKPGEGTPKCVSSAKRASMTKAERLSAARRKKKADPGQQQKSGAAKPTYVKTDSPREEMNNDNLKLIQEKDKKGKGSGTKDACYHKVKSRYSVWPSAYASGALVKCRKVGAANWGNKSEGLSWDELTEKFRTQYGDKTKLSQSSERKSLGRKSSTKDGSKPTGYESPKEFRDKSMPLRKHRERFGNLADNYNFSNWRSQFKPTEHETVDLITPDPLKPSKGIGSEMLGEKCWPGYEKKGMKTMFGKRYPNCVKKKTTRKEQVEEATRLPATTGNIIDVNLVFRGRSYMLKMFFPKVGIPSRSDVMDQIEKVYPGAKLTFFRVSDYEPGQPIIKVTEHREREEEVGAINETASTDSAAPGEFTEETEGTLNEVEASLSPQEIALQKKKGQIDMQIIKKRNQALRKHADKMKKDEVAKEEAILEKSAAWTRKAGKNKEGGLNEKGRKSYERENPGSDLKSPSKKVGNKRRASFCARMKGMKKKLTSSKTANDPDSRINKSLRAWNC
jgi:hypothetical protein